MDKCVKCKKELITGETTADLEQQLKEKDELLKKYARDAIQYRRDMQELTHQVCEKIKNALSTHVVSMEDETHAFKQKAVYWQDVVAILDKVKGEQDNAENGD